MARQFSNLRDAAFEIRRDIYKGAATKNTSVQHWDKQDLTVRERINYSYSILPDGIPDTIPEIIEIGKELGFPQFQYDSDLISDWLYRETKERLNPNWYLQEEPSERMHPALKQTLEGNVPSYTYRERFYGMKDIITETLKKSPDSRRAYWNIYLPQDTVRAISATRVPCSLGFQFFVRSINNVNMLYMIYSMRSCDVDTFWLTDVYLAGQVQRMFALELNVNVGMFYHNIGSFHSFLVDDQEIY